MLGLGLRENLPANGDDSFGEDLSAGDLVAPGGSLVDDDNENNVMAFDGGSIGEDVLVGDQAPSSMATLNADCEASPVNAGGSAGSGALANDGDSFGEDLNVCDLAASTVDIKKDGRGSFSEALSIGDLAHGSVMLLSVAKKPKKNRRSHRNS